MGFRHFGILVILMSFTSLNNGVAHAGDGSVQTSQSSLTVTPIRPTKGQKVRALKYVEVPISRYCKAAASGDENEKYKDLTLGRAAASDLRSGRVKTSPFFSAKAVFIRIEANNDACESGCRQALEESVVQGFSLWRAGCSRCRANNLVLLIVGSSVWLDVVTWDKWQYALSAGLRVPEHDPNAVSRMHLRPYGLQPLADYRKLNESSLRHTICESRDRLHIDPAILGIVCSAMASSFECKGPACVKIPIGLGQNRSKCDLTGRIACGSPDGAVGLNTNQFTFVHTNSTRDREVRIGRGQAVSLEHVVTHEMGHWFGLNHDDHRDPTGKRNIMSDGYSSRRSYCITDLNLTSLDNAVDKNWDFRLVENGGLRWDDD